MLKIGYSTDSKWALISGLRFFLAFIVFCSHLGVVGARDDSFGAYFFAFGSAEAVLSFFIISGFSIAHSIQAKPAGFFLRRLIRIYPVYLFSLILGFLPFLLIYFNLSDNNLGIELSTNDYSLLNIILSLFLLQTFSGHTVGLLGVAWSLSIEWVFYLLTPLLNRCSWWGLSILCISFLMLWIRLSGYPEPFNTFFWNLKYGLPIIMAGWAWLGGFTYAKFLNLAEKNIETTTIINAVFILFVALAVTLNHNKALEFSGRLGILTICLTAIVLTISQYVEFTRPIVKFLNYLGEISYPLFLVHYPIIIICYNVRKATTPLFYAVFVIAFSIIIFELFDRKFRLFKTKLDI